MNIRRSTLRAAGRSAVAAALLISAVGCSDDATASPPKGATTTTQATHGGAHTVEVTAVDFDFEGLPASIAAGTRLTIRNAAPSELHELVAFRLPDNERRPVTDLLKLPEVQLTSLLGAPKTVLLAPPGAEQIPAVGDGTLDEPGRYLIMCAIPTGVDPATYLQAAAASGGEKPNVAGGAPHFVSGMAAELTVR